MIIPPMNRQWRARVPCGGSAVISEYIAGVIQDNVEDHTEPRLMRGVHQCTQFLVGIRRIDRKPGFRSENRGCRSRGSCLDQMEDFSAS